MTPDIPIQGFVHEDADGPYLRCSSFVGGECCDGKQRPQAVEGDSRRWVCPDCGSSTRQLLDGGEDIAADGGEPVGRASSDPRSDGGRHPAIEALQSGASEAERFEAAVEVAVDCVREGDSAHNAAEWAVDQCELDDERLPDVRERVFGALAAIDGGAA